MKKLGEMLLNQSSFSEIAMGNTALVRAMIESGTKVVTSYPGSPTPEIAGAIRSIPTEQRPFYFEFSTNEKVATELAYGASVNGHLSTVFFKSVGLNVAADTFVQLSLMNLIGGMVVVLGDDPGANSSQNEQDNRHFARMSYTPVFEPANPTEVYHFYKAAAKLSREMGIPVILRMTTHVCHAKEKICFGEYIPTPTDKKALFDTQNGPYMPITSLVLPMKRRALKNLDRLRDWSEKSELNTLSNNSSDKGIITFGLPYLSLMDCLEDAGEKPDILKLGVVYPLAKNKIIKFLQDHKEVKIIEELDDILETSIKALAWDNKLEVSIIGKQDHEDWIGEYTPDKVREILLRDWPKLFVIKQHQPDREVTVPPRPAQMCPGCGHRSAYYAISKALEPEDIRVADIGCHTLGFLPPYKMGDLLMCMGASSGIGAGLSLFNDNRRIVSFIGDSTFFHAGMPGIVNAVFNKHNLTLIVMENGTTAMTGHQNHAATGKNFDEVVDKIPIKQVLQGLGVKHIFETDTYQQKKLTSMVKEAMGIDEFSVVIAKHPCMLKLMREQRKKSNYSPRRVSINNDKCDQKYECIKAFACPSFKLDKNGKVSVNHDLCIGDGSCIQTCPSSAVNPSQIVKKGDNS